MPISSLPSPYGIGTMGKSARKFVDFLVKGGQTYWQILPICPTSYGDSPYQSFSSFAGNPYFIDLDILCKENLLKKKECESFDWGTSEEYIDYGTMYVSRYALLHKAYARFVKNMPEDFSSFCEAEKDWLEDYTLFMALKDANDGKAWAEWDEKLRVRDAAALDEARKKYAEDIEFYKMLQYLFFKQWRELKAYANENGIEIIGDVPIYVAGDSADVWANPKQFYLDEDLNPIEVAGCPPDGFSADGQLWGNPLFRWDEMKKDNYAWWTKRIKAMSELYDIIRIDHFRGFDSYYAIPAKDKTAKNGKWKQGPGMDLFNQLEKKLGKLPIIVEDLGFLTDSVRKLLKDSGFPGMKVIQFAFDSREGSDYLPQKDTQVDLLVAQERERVAAVHDLRAENGEQLSLEVFFPEALILLAQVVKIHLAVAAPGQLFQRLGIVFVAVHLQLGGLGHDGCQLFGCGHVGLVLALFLFALALFQVGALLQRADAHHEEFVQIGTVDGQEFDLLGKGHVLVLAKSQDPAVEVQPAQFPVDKNGLVAHIHSPLCLTASFVQVCLPLPALPRRPQGPPSSPARPQRRQRGQRGRAAAGTRSMLGRGWARPPARCTGQQHPPCSGSHTSAPTAVCCPAAAASVKAAAAPQTRTPAPRTAPQRLHRPL